VIEALGNIGDFVGGIGVIVTLAYLALQIKRNTVATKADSYQSVVALASEWARDISLSAEMCDIMDRGARDFRDLSQLEAMRFNLAMSSYFRNMENLHHKFISGNVEDAVWEGWANRTLAFMDAPGTQEWWKLNDSAFSQAFRSFIDSSGERTGVPGAFGNYVHPTR
jgi:hypothetical protein